MRNFKRYTLEEFIAHLKTFVGKVRFSEVHVHHTWEPDIADFRRDGGLKLIQAMYRYHTGTRGFSDIAQHVTTDPDGYIWEGRSLLMPPASATNYNDSDPDRIHPFMFEMIGNFDIGHDKLEGAQLETVIGLVRAIMEFWKLSDSAVRFHREMSTKTCPGSGIDKGWFLQQVKGEEEIMLGKDDANKIIALLGAIWQVTDTVAPTNEGQQEVNRLANELRKASGQPVK